MNVLLQRVMGGEVFTAIFGDETKRPTPAPKTPQAPPARIVPGPILDEPSVEDHSDVIAAAVDRIRAKAHEDGHRFKPYVRSKGRKAATPEGQEDLGIQLDLGVALLRERRFEEAIEPFLKAIARDDEDRRPWILLGEAYLRVERPYKAAVAYLRSLELSPRDEQAWLGLSRVLRSLDELPTAATVLERATRIHPDHADSWAERGLIYAGMQKLPDASRAFKKALELRPDHRLALAKRSEIGALLKNQGIDVAGSIETEITQTKPAAKASEADRDSEILEQMEESLGDDEAGLAPTITALMPEPVGPATPAASKRPARVRTFVEGLDETLDGGIPWGHVVLLEGAPGTMKSSLGFSILLHNAARQGLHCLYLSLEERASSLLKQMGSLGLQLEVPKGSLVVLDPRTAADLLGEKTDWVDALEEGIRSIKAQRGLDLILIDSLEALEVLAKFKDRRREMYRLFEWLRDLDVTSIVITERPDWLIAGHVLQGRWDEDFLADGVFHLRIHMVTDLEAQRRLRVVKMRGTKHDTGYVAMVLDEEGFRVTRAMSP
jgi:KaiC/GvpD/RAD55 family RecA-like ATPase